jgi:hypothetical protein
MAKKNLIKGTKLERNTFTQVIDHYQMSEEDLEQRESDWDKKDELFRSYINTSNYPYNAKVFDPRVFTFIFEKSSRMFARKPRGRLVPREGGDVLGARINNQLLSYQWDDNERVDNRSMLAKWAIMDQNCRKYGASFALVNWRYERKLKRKKKNDGESQIYFDGPDFIPWANRDVLHNPSYSTIKKWIQLRSYVTIDELTKTNDAARGKPVYKNLDILRDSLKAASQDRRDNNYISKNKSIKGLTDYLGSDETFKVVEVVTEYRQDRWITFSPKHGIILRDIPNPYDHCEIPVVQLKYIEIDDDIYGLSEIEPVERLQKAANSLINQYLDAVNMSLYAPLKIRANSVQMHTLEFGPASKWIMNDPSSDVVTHDQSITGVSEFTSTYSFMISALQNAVGESSAGVSAVNPFEGDKTATEVRQSAMQRNVRDAFNQVYLSGAMKKQMMFWHSMNKQFLFNNPAERQKIIRITGRDSLRYFQKIGLDKMVPTKEGEELLQMPELDNVNVRPSEIGMPMFPVETAEGIVPKLQIDQTGEEGDLIIEPDDMNGLYDYIPDIESMALPNDAQIAAQKRQLLELATNPSVQQILQSEGTKIKYKELLIDLFEQLGVRDAEKYFEKARQPKPIGQAQQARAGSVQPGMPNSGNEPNQGMAGGNPTMAASQA